MKLIYVNNNQLTYTLNENLTHYTTYNIELYVCRQRVKNENTESNKKISYCSIQKAMTTVKTSPKGKFIVLN